MEDPMYSVSLVDEDRDVWKLKRGQDNKVWFVEPNYMAEELRNLVESFDMSNLDNQTLLQTLCGASPCEDLPCDRCLARNLLEDDELDADMLHIMLKVVALYRGK